MLLQLDIHKQLNGRHVQISEWEARIHKYFHYIQDGVIYVPAIFEYAFIYPIGVCECGRCEALWLPDPDQAMLWEYSSQMIICQDCICDDVYAEPIIHITFATAPLRDDPTVRVTFEDVVQAYAPPQVLGMHYFDGKSAADLYQEMLARRVARRWRAMARRKFLRRITWVMKEKLQLDECSCTAFAEIAVAS